MRQAEQDRERNTAMAVMLVIILAIGVIGFLCLAGAVLSYSLK